MLSSDSYSRAPLTVGGPEGIMLVMMAGSLTEYNNTALLGATLELGHHTEIDKDKKADTLDKSQPPSLYQSW